MLGYDDYYHLVPHIENVKHALLLVIFFTCIGGFLRFYNLNWDDGHSFHPDERNIANAVARIEFFEQLNPGFFAYGGFSIYLYRATGDIFSLVTKSAIWNTDWGHINLIGRFYSAFFSTLTIPLIFFLAKKVFTKEVALIAIFLATFTVSFIQTAHFGITESFLALMATLIALFSINLLENPSIINYLMLGFAGGLITATKTTAFSFLLFPITSHFFITAKRGRHIRNSILSLLVFLLSGVITFAVFSPYTFLSFTKFIESMRYESGVALGTLAVPYTLQFTNTPPYLFQIENFFWQLGPAAIPALLGIPFLFFYAFKKRNPVILILLSFPTIYFLYVGAWHTKFIRFMLPLLPFLIIIASWFLSEVKKRFKLAGILLISFMCLITCLWAIAFFTIYTKEQTRITASRWMYYNIAANSKILGEHWDDGLPVSISFFNPSAYRIEQLTIYDPDNEQKINYYAEKLATADYIVINSRRLYGTLIHLTEKYPITSRYYTLLFGDKLGYEKVAEFTSYPALFGIEVNDDASEETFQIYEHPKVMIFKNISRLSPKAIEQILKPL